MTTKNISNMNHERAFDGGVFGASPVYQADGIALASGRVDEGRLELHRAAEAEMARTGATYEGALDAVLTQARRGMVTLSAVALAGTGIDPARHAGRGGLIHDARTGEVVTAARAPIRAQLTPAPEESSRFLDTLAACAILKAGASLEDRRLATEALVRRARGRMVG